MMTTPEQIIAPWTPEQVDALNAFQRYDFRHPFTCPNEHRGDRTLIATRHGWLCPHCDYTQYWAYKFMLDPPIHPLKDRH
jgi:hypothetical protein